MNGGREERLYRILLLEDNPADIYLFRKALEEAGLKFELTVIENGAEGLTFGRHEGRYSGKAIPDVAVLDLNLPKGGGGPVLEAMRRSDDLKGVPVVIMSSSATPDEQEKATALGVERFITKPPNLDEFLQIGEVIKEILLRTV